VNTEMATTSLPVMPTTDLKSERATVPQPSPTTRSLAQLVVPQDDAHGSCGCSKCASAAHGKAEPSFVYAIGRIEARFPTLSVEKEFAQTTGRAETAGRSDQQAFQSVLARRESRYLARQLCWVFSVQGLPTYLLRPRESSDLDLLIEAIRPAPSPLDVDVVVGLRGPVAPAEMCNGLMLPIVMIDQVYTFDRNALISAIPKPEKTTAAAFEPMAHELFDRVIQLADNAGATDEHRALNYLTMRYPAIYHHTADQHAKECSLASVETRQSRLGGARKILDVIFTYRHRTTDVADRFFVRVDVTEEFPFLVSKLSPYYER
jgi:PatG Domain